MIRTLKNTFLIFWATAVLFICVGTLINFHQHKIWGKPLLPHLLYAKRDKEQTLDLLKVLKADVPVASDPSSAEVFAVISDQPNQISLSQTDLIRCDSSNSAVFKVILASRPLRAPPVFFI